VNWLIFDGVENRGPTPVVSRCNLVVIPKGIFLLDLAAHHHPWLARKRDNFFNHIATAKRHSQKIPMRAAAYFSQHTFVMQGHRRIYRHHLQNFF